MIKGEGHGVDAVKILAVEDMLLARQSTALPSEIRGERADHRIEHGNGRHLKPATTIDQRSPQIFVHESIEHHAGIGGDAVNDALDLRLGPHHRPNMFDRLYPIKLHEARARDRMHGVAGRIGDEMNMKPSHDQAACG